MIDRPRFDPATGRPLVSPTASGDRGPDEQGGGGSVAPVLMVRRSTLLRDLILVTLHLAVYVAVTGTRIVAAYGVGSAYGLFAIRPNQSSLAGIFWPAFVWGSVIAAQAGAAVFQHRRWMGAMIGAMSSVVLGSVLMWYLFSYGDVPVVLAGGACVLASLAVAVSLGIRPPGFFRGPGARVTSDPATVAASPGRPRLVSVSSVLLAGIAVLIVVISLGEGTYRSFEVRGSGVVGTRAVDGGTFTRISAHGIDQLTLRLGDEPRVEIHGDDNLIGFVAVASGDGALDLSFTTRIPTPVRTRTPLVVDITMPVLEELIVDDAVNVSLETFSGPRLRIVAGGQSHVALDQVTADRLEVVVRDEAVVRTYGDVGTLALDGSDTGSFNAPDLVVMVADVAGDDMAITQLGELGELTYRQAGRASILFGSAAEIGQGSMAEDSRFVVDSSGGSGTSGR